MSEREQNPRLPAGVESGASSLFIERLEPSVYFHPMMGGVLAVFFAFGGSWSNANENNVNNSEDK